MSSFTTINHVIITPAPNPSVLHEEKRAIEAGRDGAAIFRSNEKRSPLRAVELAERLLNYQCPEEQKLLAIKTFNSYVGTTAYAYMRGEDLQAASIAIDIYPIKV
jgi:hypothetical protein